MKGKKITGRSIRTITGIFFLLTLVIAGYISIDKLKFEESIASILPADEENKLLAEILDSADIFDRIVFHIRLTDSSGANPDQLTETARELMDSMENKFVPKYISKIEGRADPVLQYTLTDNFYKYLPIYLGDEDYVRLDSLLTFGDFDKLLREHLKRLNSPAGMVLGRFILRDPLGLAAGQMNRLKDMQPDKDLTVYKNFLLTGDHKNLVFFVTPSDASNTGESDDFIRRLEEIIKQLENDSGNILQISYIGSLPVAHANALQIKRDIQLTVTLALLVISGLIYYFFRKKRVLILILLPALFGAIIAIIVLGLVYPGISMISLGIGAVLLGISVDYALHLYTHFKHEGSLQQSALKVAEPILMSSFTTSAAFLCLMLLSSPAMRQLGLFSAVSVISAALLSILILPRLIPDSLVLNGNHKSNLIEALAGYEPKSTMLPLLILLAISIVFFVFAGKAEFEKDIEKSNFMPSKLMRAQEQLNKVSSLHQKKLYLLSQGTDFDRALENMEKQEPILADLFENRKIGNYNSIHSVIYSRSYQELRIKKWEEFWTAERRRTLKQKLEAAGTKNHFKANAFSGFYDLLDKDFSPVGPDTLFHDFSALVNNFRINLSDRTLIATLVDISSAKQKSALQIAFSNEPDAFVLDRKDFFLRIFETIQMDFDKLIRLSLILVFLIILIFFGRIELAVITFLPILLSWIWTLGIMGITGLKLNYFNIIICSLIFGLGVDYSIFITRGLLRKYTYGSNDLLSFKSSILISVITTTVGLGVLIFARHPALRSIAALAITGIISVVIISFTLQPILFKLLTGSRQGSNTYPITLLRIAFSAFIFGVFGIMALVLTLLIPVLMILPVRMSQKQYVARYITSFLLRGILKLYPSLRVERRNISRHDFDKASIIVSNHQSMIDILLGLSLSPKVLLLTKDWVWNNPVFGLIARFSGHLNVTQGFDRLQQQAGIRMSEGCSILSFPEGSRSFDGSIRRYHKGAFYLAQQLEVPVQVFMIHGAYEGLSRSSIFFTPGHITISKLYTTHLAKNEDRAYYFAARKICSDTRHAFKLFYEDEENPRFYRSRVMGNFIYKGPVLENYMRIKLRLENNYRLMHELIPRKATITDIGCGYGAMDFMLCLKSNERRITGIDYDKAKIAIALACSITRNYALSFVAGDALDVPLTRSDVFLLSDMLHYLPPDKQTLLLGNCLDKLNAGGRIIIRDSDSSLKRRHRGTRLSEFLSTGLGFNKARFKLSFVSRGFVAEFAEKHDLRLRIIDNTRFNSNVVYLLSLP